jgi:hypothetical protein
MTLPFGANIDIRDTVRYRDVMKEYGIGPNGGILTSNSGLKWYCHHRMVKVNDTYMFRNEVFFLLLDGFIQFDISHCT